MIRFIQDYTTRAIPPEHFAAGDEVTRSDASELYFVQLGVAGYVTEAGLVDQDHRQINPASSIAEVVVPGENRSGLAGRAGELMLGLDAPQRGTSGPGNAVLAVGGDQQTAAAAGELDRLTSALEHAGSDVLAVTAERDRLLAELEQAGQLGTEIGGQLDAEKVRTGDLQRELETERANTRKLQEALATAEGRISDLETKVASASESASGETAREQTAPAKTAAKSK